MPGINALLNALGSRGEVVLGLLTGNFREGARLKLGHYELEHHFQFGGYGDHHLDRDDVAREALAEIHGRFDTAFDPQRVWVIGDTPADVQCGRAIGAKVVAVGTGLYSADELEAAAPDHLFPDFSDPEPLLSLIVHPT